MEVAVEEVATTEVVTEVGARAEGRVGRWEGWQVEAVLLEVTVGVVKVAAAMGEEAEVAMEDEVGMVGGSEAVQREAARL